MDPIVAIGLLYLCVILALLIVGIWKDERKMRQQRKFNRRPNPYQHLADRPMDRDAIDDEDLIDW